MWFRRNKKKRGETDSALSDTLDSLQSLLEEKKTASSDSTLPEPTGASLPEGEDPGDKVSSTEPDGQKIKNAVASDEHLEWDFKVDLAAEEEQKRPRSPAFLREVAAGQSPVVETPETEQTAATRIEPETTVPGAEESRADDGIPVLTNVVYLPVKDRTGEAESPETVVAENPFVDQCIKDIKKRLKRHEMSPLTEYQERQFRTALTSLLVQKSSGMFD